MSREIKFRAWKHTYTPSGSSGIGEMVYDIRLGNSIWNNKDIEVNKILNDTPRLMQYTGIKDKNGKEIYEGDILTHIVQGNRFVEFGSPKTSYAGYMLVNKDGMRGTLQDTERLYEVIGNIYENIELLDG